MNDMTHPNALHCRVKYGVYDAIIYMSFMTYLTIACARLGVCRITHLSVIQNNVSQLADLQK